MSLFFFVAVRDSLKAFSNRQLQKTLDLLLETRDPIVNPHLYFKYYQHFARQLPSKLQISERTLHTEEEQTKDAAEEKI